MLLGTVLALGVAWLQVFPVEITVQKHEIAKDHPSGDDQQQQKSVFIDSISDSVIPASGYIHIQYESTCILEVFGDDIRDNWSSFLPQIRINPIRATRILFRTIISPNAP